MLPAVGSFSLPIGLKTPRCVLYNGNQGENYYSFTVYVGSMPLRAPPGIGQWAISTADRILQSTQLQHFYTILESSADSVVHVNMDYTVFDFQPQNPEDSYAALIALSGGAVPGMVMVRKISRLPNRRCWKVGPMRSGLNMEDAVNFNMKWDTNLQLWKHDCRHHTNEFVEFLTGKKEILDELTLDL